MDRYFFIVGILSIVSLLVSIFYRIKRRSKQYEEMQKSESFYKNLSADDFKIMEE